MADTHPAASASRTIAIIGAGGFAREVEWLIREIGEPWRFVGFLADRQGQYDSPTLGDFSWLGTNHVDALAIGIGNPKDRLRLGVDLKHRFPHIEWPALVHPTVLYDKSSCRLSEGVVICCYAAFSVGVSIGKFAMVNGFSTIGHESSIGDGAVVNSAFIAGGVSIGDCAFIGARATVLQYLSIGKNAVVGAAALVTTSVPDGAKAVGIRAKRVTQEA